MPMSKYDTGGKTGSASVSVVDATGKRCPEVLLACRDALKSTNIVTLITDDPVGPRDVRHWCWRSKVVNVIQEHIATPGVWHMTLKRN